MAKLYAISLDGTSYNMNLDCIKSDSGSKVQNGYAYFPSGVLLQWGLAYCNTTGNTFVPFPISFPLGAMSCACTTVEYWITSGTTSMQYGCLTLDDGTGKDRFRISINRGDGASYNAAVHWMVIGY